MSQSLLQSVTAALGWGGIQKFLQDQQITTNAAAPAVQSILSSYFTTIPNVIDFGTNMYVKGAWQLRCKAGLPSYTYPYGVTNTPGLDTRLANPLTTVVGGIITLELSGDVNFTATNTVRLMDGCNVPTYAGEFHFGPVVFSTDPITFRYARLIVAATSATAGSGPGYGIYDLEMIAVP